MQYNDLTAPIAIDHQKLYTHKTKFLYVFHNQSTTNHQHIL